MTLLTFLTRLLCGDWSGLDALSGWRTRGCPSACCSLPWRRPDQHVTSVSDGEIVFCLMCVLGMRLTPGLSPPLHRELSGALCSPPQYDLFSSLQKSNARCAFVCFLVVEIFSATNVQQKDRSELKTSSAHDGAPIADVGFGARVDLLSTDVALPLVAILCSENRQLQSACQHDGRPTLNMLSLALSVDVGGVLGDSRTCLAIALSASRRLLLTCGAPSGHIWHCVPRSKVQGPRCVCVCVCVCVCGCVCVCM